MTRRVLALLVAVLLLAMTLMWRSVAVAAPDNAMAVDGDFTITTADPFDVELRITVGADAYEGYQFLPSVGPGDPGLR